MLLLFYLSVDAGDTFSAGDVLLEIETDKAQIDVEAPDDGVMAKILILAGSKNIAVGKRIAVLADEGDDLASLDIPPEAQKEQPKEPLKEKKAAPAPEKASPTSKQLGQKQQPYQPSPSVASLLRQLNIPESEASSIPATGPKGRLLKGDILAYAGKIDGSHPNDLSTRILSLSKLDLSNIKPAASKPKKVEQPQAHTPPPAPKLSEFKVAVNFAEADKVLRKYHLPLSQFLDRAVASANSQLPPPKLPKSTDELFNEILGLPNPPPGPTRGNYRPEISPAPRSGRAVAYVKQEADIYDVLLGDSDRATTVAVPIGTQGILAGGENILSLSVPQAEEERARVFLRRLKSWVEETPEQLITA